MQEKETIGYMKRFILAITYILMWGLLALTWSCFVLAALGMIDAIDNYGLLSLKVLMDARLGYYGLFSFGLASCAVLLANKTGLRSNIVRFRVFKVTFFISLIFFMPTIFSILIFLIAR